MTNRQQARLGKNRSTPSRPARPRPPRAVTRQSPLVIRTLSDLRAIAASPRAAKHLPPDGLVIELPDLDEPTRRELRAHIRQYARSCGCAVGGATFLLAGIAGIVHASYLAWEHAWASLPRVLAATVIGAPTLTLAAKSLDLQFARLRFRHHAARLIESANARTQEVHS